ncbi:hypothetical protein OTU49_004046 [Cherax quadricarinatus]|uniref:HIT-type domain-containing protein n=1 Tax=Cherax quadricarinatus TaxID=27406 RepID=A0AAW0X2I4_CHEQU
MAASSNSGCRKCAFCPNNSQYSCPRCNVQYCSSKCYKHQNHAQCSESFYEDMIKEELRSGTLSEESRKKMMRILHRIKAGDSVMGDEEDEPLDSDDDEDLAARMMWILMIVTQYGKSSLKRSDKSFVRSLIRVVLKT